MVARQRRLMVNCVPVSPTATAHDGGVAEARGVALVFGLGLAERTVLVAAVAEAVPLQAEVLIAGAEVHAAGGGGTVTHVDIVARHVAGVERGVPRAPAHVLRLLANSEGVGEPVDPQTFSMSGKHLMGGRMNLRELAPIVGHNKH